MVYFSTTLKVKCSQTMARGLGCLSPTTVPSRRTSFPEGDSLKDSYQLLSALYAPVPINERSEPQYQSNSKETGKYSFPLWRERGDSTVNTLYVSP